MSPSIPAHFCYSTVACCSWNCDGLWVANDDVRHDKLTYLQYLLRKSHIVNLQEVRMSDTDFLAFGEWLRRLPGNWKFIASASESARRLGGMILWSPAFQGHWYVNAWELVAGAMHGLTFCNSEGEAEIVVANVHFSPHNSRERREQYAHLRAELPQAKWRLVGGDHNRSDAEGDRLLLRPDEEAPGGTRWTLSEAPERRAWQAAIEALGMP